MSEWMYYKNKKDQAFKNLTEIIAYIIVGLVICELMYLVLTACGVEASREFNLFCFVYTPVAYGLRYTWTRIFVFNFSYTSLYIAIFLFGFKCMIGLILGYILLPINIVSNIISIIWNSSKCKDYEQQQNY